MAMAIDLQFKSSRIHTHIASHLQDFRSRNVFEQFFRRVMAASSPFRARFIYAE